MSDGQIEQAIDLFEMAAEAMCGNKAINLNAAKVLIMHMEKNGLKTNYLAQIPAVYRTDTKTRS